MMPRRLKLRLILFAAIIFFGYANNCIAQNASLEFWPETDIWYRLSRQWRLSTYIPVTKYYESKDRDLNIYLQADYAWGRTKYSAYRRMMDENRVEKINAWMGRIGFMEGWSLQDWGESYTEDMLYPEIHRRIPLKGNILMSHRIRTDFRWIGEEPEFSYRFRYRLMLEKEFSPEHSSVVPFVSAEPFWDSRYMVFNRIRLIGGTTVSWSPGIALEGNLTYQYDSRSSVNNVYAINIILHVFFESRRVKKKVESN